MQHLYFIILDTNIQIKFLFMSRPFIIISGNCICYEMHSNFSMNVSPNTIIHSICVCYVFLSHGRNFKPLLLQKRYKWLLKLLRIWCWVKTGATRWNLEKGNSGIHKRWFLSWWLSVEYIAWIRIWQCVFNFVYFNSYLSRNQNWRSSYEQSKE